MKEICKKYIKDDILQIPFKLIGADQVLPVDFEIKARMTTDLLKFTMDIPSPVRNGEVLADRQFQKLILGRQSGVEFGTIYKGQASRRPIQIENLSTLP